MLQGTVVMLYCAKGVSGVAGGPGGLGPICGVIGGTGPVASVDGRLEIGRCTWLFPAALGKKVDIGGRQLQG